MIDFDVECPLMPGMLKKVVHADSLFGVFVAVTKDLSELAEAEVSRERVERWTKRVGEHHVVQVDAATEEYQAWFLPQLLTRPTKSRGMACVQMDGG